MPHSYITDGAEIYLRSFATIRAEADLANSAACAAAVQGCDAVIMGSHGMGLVRSALGSVSRGMLEHAPVPVTFVKAPPESESEADADE